MIETERLILRPFQKDDAKDLFMYLNSPMVHCFMSMQVKNMEEANQAIESRIKQEHYFAIVLKETGKVIGEIFCELENANMDQSDVDTASPCWMLHPSYQRKGYMFEAITAYFDYLFDICHVRRIYIYTEDDNVACQKLCEKLGMRKEGEYKEFVSFIKDEMDNPIYENTLEYAILKKEWKKG